MSAVFKKVLVLVMLVALLVSAMPVLCEEALVEPGEEAPAELGEMNLFDPAVYDGEYAEQVINVDAPRAIYIPGSASGAPLAPEANGVLGVTVTNVTVRASERFQTRVTFDAPYGGYMYCASSNTAVMQCGWSDDWDGFGATLNIVGIAAGTATVTLTNSLNSERVYIYVTVLPFQEVTVGSITLKPGQTTSVDVYFPGYGYLYYYNDNTSVCACEWEGNVTGKRIRLFITGVNPGTATVRITNDYNSETNWIKVNVTGPSYPKKGKKDGKQSCRALLIGEEAFNPICTRNTGDTELMSRMLKSVKGPKGKGWTVTRKINVDSNGVKDAIYKTFNKADEDDISLFFIATHGDVNSSGSYAGALSMIPENSSALLMSELAEALKAVPGKVIVIIESCGSGAGVFSTYAEQNDLENAMRSIAKRFDNAVIDAFAEADTGIIEGEAVSGPVAFGDEWNTGELRVKNKFYVLVASRYQELSWGTEQGPYNYFTKWLTNGIGTSGRMPADTNKNGKTTLNELFKYISKVGDNYTFYDKSGGRHYQHVQVYPKNSSFDLFKR